MSFGSLTSSFRGYDGMRTIAEAIRIAGKPEPEAIRAALWKVDILGLNGPIKFEKDGPAGQESGQSTPNVYLVKIEDGKVTVPKIDTKGLSAPQRRVALRDPALAFAARWKFRT